MPCSAVRLIAMDMDGTLLTPPPARISPAAADVLREAQAAGIALALCSGRLIDDASFFARDAGLDMVVIGLNGGCMAMHPFGPVENSVHHTLKDAQAILRLLLASSLTFALFSDEALIIRCADPASPVPDLVWGTYMLREGSRVRVYREPDDFSPFLDQVSKFVVLDPSLSGALTALRARVVQLRPDLSISASWEDNMEINPAGTDKGVALRTLADRLQVPMSSVMAIGDQINDLPMLRAAGFSVAMGNAHPDVVKACRFLTSTNAEDGVAAAVLHLALHREQKAVTALPMN